MKILELFSLFKNFSEIENLEFKNFLLSPFLVENKTLINIFNVIFNNSNLLSDKDPEKLLKKICNKLKHSRTTIIQRLSFLNKAALNYLKIKSLTNDVENSEYYLNKFLLQNNYITILDQNLKRSQELLNSSGKFKEKYFWDSFNYNVLYCDAYTKNIRLADTESKDTVFPHIVDASLNLSLYFLIQQINLYVYNLLLHVDTGNYKIFYFPLDIINLLEIYDRGNYFSKSPEINEMYKLYKLMFLAFHDKNRNEYFEEYKLYFKKSIKFLDIELINIHYNLLMNYCIMKSRLQEDIDYFERQKVELLLEYIDKGYFKTESVNYLHASVYRNFILTAYSIGEYDLLKNFIDSYSTKLNSKDCNDMMNFGLVYYYYAVRKYEQVEECIKNIQMTDYIYKYDIKNIELRVYFETGNDDELEKTIHNYHKYVMEDDLLNKPDKDRLFKLLKYLNKIISLKNNPNKNLQKESKYLINIINKEPIFALKNWLLTILDKLSQTAKITSN